MPFDLHKLDDRRFQDFVDEAKSHISRYCPEWTDHNVSDPGITLIELFAGMADQLIYRVNQLPQNIYLTLLNLLDIRPHGPQAAVAPVTFYLARAQTDVVRIRSGAEIATLRTETEPATIFSTEEELAVQPAIVEAALTVHQRTIIPRDLSVLALNAFVQPPAEPSRIAIFTQAGDQRPQEDDAFYLALSNNHSRHVIALVVRSKQAQGMGVRPDNPPLVWEVWQGGTTRWALCEWEDNTGGFSYPTGEIVLHVPTMARRSFNGIEAYWLRCRLAKPSDATGSYDLSPQIESIRVESRGATVYARHAVIVTSEVLGVSDGQPGQIFQLRHTPVLGRNPEVEHLRLKLPDGSIQDWEERSDFADSQADDKHYTLDSLKGTLTLGPQIRLPNGESYCFGAIPPKGAELSFTRYRYGGGISGNIEKHRLSVLRTADPRVNRVINREKARGGSDAESLDLVKLRAPKQMRTRGTAITAEDYIYHALRVPGVARAQCIGPGDTPGAPKPGEVALVILPHIDNIEGYPSEQQLTPSEGLTSLVSRQLTACSPLGVGVTVRRPRLVFVAIRATIQLGAVGDKLRQEGLDRAEEALRNFLNPYSGGPNKDGWPFGRPLRQREVENELLSIPTVDSVISLEIVHGPSLVGPFTRTPALLNLAPDELICSARHTISIATS